MRFAIVENNETECEQLLSLIRRHSPEGELAFYASTVEQAVEQFRRHADVDLAFMEVELSDGKSFDAIRSAGLEMPVVFISAEDLYASKSFKFNSIDYLVKPLTQVAVDGAIDKFEAFY